MAGSIMDMLATLTGRPDPQMQLAAYLNQAPGQVGSNAPGPVPGAPGPQGSPSGGGAPNPAQGAPQAGQGAPQGQGGMPSATMPGGQQAPNAFQSPSDLGSLYLQLAQRQQASNQFNTGLGLLAASAYPGRRPDIITNAMRDMNQQNDPSELFGNLMKLQMYGQQQQNIQAMRASIPKMLSDAGISQDYAPLVMTNPDLLSKIVETQAGVGGGPAWMAQQRAEKALTAQGKPIPWTPGDPVSYDAYTKATTAAQVTTADTANKEKLAAKTEFDGMDKQYQAVEQNIDWLNDPAHRDAVVQAIKQPELFTSGQAGKYLSGTPLGVSQDVLDAKSKLDQLHNQLYATSFSGKNQRLAAVEAQRLGNAYTNLVSPTLSPGAIGDELTRLQQQAYTSHANVFASAGQQIPAKYHGLADSQYLNPRDPLYNGATEEAPASQAPAQTASQAPASSSALKPLTDAQKQQARDLIARDGRDAVIKHLQGGGYDTSGL